MSPPTRADLLLVNQPDKQDKLSYSQLFWHNGVNISQLPINVLLMEVRSGKKSQIFETDIHFTTLRATSNFHKAEIFYTFPWRCVEFLPWAGTPALQSLPRD